MIRECFSYPSDKNTTGEALESDGSGLVRRVSGDARQWARLSQFRRLSEAVPAGDGSRLAYPFRHLIIFKAVFVDVKPARVFVLA